MAPSCVDVDDGRLTAEQSSEHAPCVDAGICACLCVDSPTAPTCIVVCAAARVKVKVEVLLLMLMPQTVEESGVSTLRLLQQCAKTNNAQRHGAMHGKWQLCTILWFCCHCDKPPLSVWLCITLKFSNVHEVCARHSTHLAVSDVQST